MIVEAPSDRADAAQEQAEPHARPGFLPPFSSMALAALAANAPAIGGLLLFNKLALALSVVAGYALALIVYGFLYIFVTTGMNPLIEGIRGQANPPVQGAMGIFILQLMLKFVGLALLIYCLMHFLPVNVIGLAVGAILSQVAVTAFVIKNMSSKTDPRSC